MSVCIEGRVDAAFDNDNDNDNDNDFAIFYATHFPRVYARLRRMGARHADAEEIAQEAMLRTWRKRDTHVDEEHSRKYVHTVATTLYIDLLRKADSHTLPLGDHDVASTGESPLEAAARAEERRALGAALRRLPPAERQLLIDAEVHGLGADELTVRYGAKIGALRVRRFRTRRALQPQVEHLRAAPTLLVAFVGRRCSHAIRACTRWLHDFGDGLTPNVIAVMITTLSLVAVPFGATPLRPPAAYADETMPTTTPRQSDDEDDLPDPLEEVTSRDHPATSTTTAGRSGRPTETTKPPQRPKLPTVCVGSACTPGGNPNEPGDVLVLHLPGPVGDREVRQNAVAVCKWVPDSQVADCHTEGKPDYRVPLPPRL